MVENWSLELEKRAVALGFDFDGGETKKQFIILFMDWNFIAL